MASIQREFEVAAAAHDVWAAARHFGAVHTRLAPGFATDCVTDGDSRPVTFSNGTSARELLVDCDVVKRRLVNSVVSERIKQHNASVQILENGGGRSRFISTSICVPTTSRLTSAGRWTCRSPR